MKRTFRKIFSALLAAVLIAMLMPVGVYASGSYYVSTSSLSLTVGSSGGFSFGAQNAVGAFSISTDGGVSASCSDELWVDNSSVYITVTGNTIGTGHVYITVYDGTDYDENDMSGQSLTVTVTVSEPEGDTVYNGTTSSSSSGSSSSGSSSSGSSNSGSSSSSDSSSSGSSSAIVSSSEDDEEETTSEETTAEETTAEADETELLSVVIDEVSMTVVKDLSEMTPPTGFEIEEAEYNTVTVDTFVCEDVTVYVLEDEDGNTAYYTLNDSGEFEPLKYTEIDGDFFVFLDMPSDLVIPDGYILTSTQVYGFSVVALTVDGEALEEEENSEEGEEENGADEEDTSETTTESEIKAFYSVGAALSEEEVSAAEDEDDLIDDQEDGLGTEVEDLADSYEGHYYIYCLLNGEEVLCDYDSERENLSACAGLPEIGESAESEVLVVYETLEEEEEASGWAGFSSAEKVLLTVLVILGIIAIILAVTLVYVYIKNRKLAKENESFNLDDIDFEEEELFEEDLEDNDNGNTQERRDVNSEEKIGDILSDEFANMESYLK